MENLVKDMGVIVAGEGEEDLVLWTKQLAKQQQKILEKEIELAEWEKELEAREVVVADLENEIAEEQARGNGFSGCCNCCSCKGKQTIYIETL